MCKLEHDVCLMELFCNLMNYIGNYAPDHESVGFIYPDRGEVLVPWNEPSEGTALIYLELLDGEFAIHEGDYEIAVRWFSLSIHDGKVAVENACILHAVA